MARLRNPPHTARKIDCCDGDIPESRALSTATFHGPVQAAQGPSSVAVRSQWRPEEGLCNSNRVNGKQCSTQTWGKGTMQGFSRGCEVARMRSLLLVVVGCGLCSLPLADGQEAASAPAATASGVPSLYIAGTFGRFTSADGVVHNVSGIAEWRDNTIKPVGMGVSLPQEVYALDYHPLPPECIRRYLRTRSYRMAACLSAWLNMCLCV